MCPGCCLGGNLDIASTRTFSSMDACCSRFTAPEGGARLAAVAAEKNTLAVEYSAFVSTRLLHEDAYKIRGLLSKGYQRSVYITRASRVAYVAYELHILTDLVAVKALEYSDEDDWQLVLEEKQVLVCTSQVIKMILQEGVLSIPQINVLIIDSCHLIFEDPHLQYVMNCYKQCPESEQPRILALTYPLFTSGKDSDVQTDNSVNNTNDEDEKAATSNIEKGSNVKVEQTDKIVTDSNAKTPDELVKVSESDQKPEHECNDDGDSQKMDDDVDKKSDKVRGELEKIDEILENGTDSSNKDIALDSDKIDALKDGKGETEETVDTLNNSKKQMENSDNGAENKQLKNETKDKDDITENPIENNSIETNHNQKTEISKDKAKDSKKTDSEAKEKIKKPKDEVEKAETDPGKIRKDKKHVKSADLVVCPKENYDDFDKYCKLEWKIEQLEEALCCKMDLAEDIDGGKRLANTIAKPKELLIEYSPKVSSGTKPGVYEELENYMREEVASAVAFMDEHRYDPSEIYGDELYEEFMNIPDPTIEPKLMFNQFLYVLDQLGPFAADKAAFSLLVKLEKLKIKVPYERHFLLLCLCTSVFVKIRCYADLIMSKYDDWEKIRMFSTPKVLRFAEILEQFQTPEHMSKANSEIKESKEVDSRNNGEEDRNTIKENNLKVSESNDLNKNDTENESRENLHNNMQCESRSNDKSTKNCEDFGDRRIVELETILGNDRNSDNNKNSKDCTIAIYKSNSNLINSTEDKLVIDSENPSEHCLEQSDSSNSKIDDNNVDTKSKNNTVTSKTTKLLDEIEKCDFVSLGNKIEDRVNTYEANLKDLDDSYTADKIVDTIDKNDAEIEKDESGSNRKVKVESNKHKTKLKDNKTFDNNKNQANKEVNMEEISENITENSDNKTDSPVKVDSKAGTINDENTKIDAINTKPDILEDKTDTVTAKTDENEKNDTCIEKETIVEARQNVLELRHKPPGLRRPHRVRGRGRVHRSHAARLQQMQQNPDALCGIVFMREPLVAKIMFMIIVDMSRSRPSLSHLCAQYCAVETDGDDSRPQGKKHEDVLKKFRMHECNLLLATPALEEGIDLPRCNLVVRWDLPPSYRSHGLCRSRARAPRSSLALMAEAHTTSEELLDNLSVYKELDQIISRKCGCGIQNEPPAAEEVHADIFTSVIKPYTPVDEKDRQTDKIKGEIVKDNHENISEDKISLLTEDNRQENVDTNINKEKEDVLKVILEENDGSKKNAAIQMKMVEDGDNNDKAQINDEIALSGVEKNDIENDESNISNNKVDRIIIKECVDGITKEVIRTEVIIKQIDKDGVVKIKTDSKNSEISEALNELDKNTIDKLDKNIPIDSESVNKDFNITYDLSKSVCDCKGVCKCNLSVNGAKSKADKKSEEGQCSVDLSTAIALINRYCGKLPSDTFTRLAPQYWMEEVQLPDKRTGELRTAYICTLRLPLNCPVKYNIVGHPMPTRVLARRMVALQACRILHKSGELDNQLMPIGKENFKAAELESTTHSDNENNDSARPGTTKRRQYYYKRTASAFTDCQPLVDSTDAEIEQQSWQEAKESYKARFPPDTKRNTLFALSSRLWCALPERYNTRGRRLHAPQHAPHAQAVLMATCDPHGLQIPAFPVYTRSGEVRVAIEPALHADVRLSPRRARLVRRFMRFVFSDVLRVRRRGMRLQTEGSTHNNYYIVPTIRVNNEDGTSHVDIDWSFLELIYQHTEEKKISAEKPLLLQQDGEEDEGEVEDSERERRAPKREREKDGKVKQMENPFLKPGEVFVFMPEKYRDAVVTPWYRNRDQPQYFLVAEICWNLSPDSAFPSVSHGSFRDYYMSKYGVTLTQPHQPLLDVDHTSARLNLLTPRYVNRKGVALPVSSERTRRAKRDRLDQKQILVPELCTVHPFAAPLWFATVALPCVLYRINALLIADEIRRSVSADVALGAPPVRGVPPPQWPPLDFGWSLAEVLNTDEKGEKGEKKKEEDDSRKEQKEIHDNQEKESSKEDTSTEEKESGKEGDGEEKTEVKEKTINDILQEKEDAESGFEIGTWSNEMASSIPQEYDEFMEPLPPNLTFCTSASGGANWSDAIPKQKGSFGASKAFSMAESDCSYLSSDFDTDDSDLNSEGSDEDMDSGGFGSKNYAAMGVRIEYKTAHEAEAVDLERKAKASNAPQLDPEDDARDLVCQRRMLREGRPPDEYIEKYNNSVTKHKEDIKSSRLIADKEPIKEILPDTAKEMEQLREQLANKLKKNKLTDITNEVLRTGKILGENNAIENEVTSDNSKTEENNVIENELISDNSKTDSSNKINVSKTIEASETNCVDSKELSNESDCNKSLEVRLEQNSVTTEEIENVKNIDVKTERNSASIKLNLTNDFSENDVYKINTKTQVSDVESPEDKINTTNFEKDFKTELLDEIFPYGDALDIQNGHVTLESIEKNKRVILNKFKASLTKEEMKKFNCFSMLDIDIDSPDYVNEKVVNVGFDTKENYVDKVNSFRNPKEYTPYYHDNKGQNGKEFNFDYQPDLEGHPGPSPSVILQALTMSNANDGINLERLETIGDSFLKFAITAYLYCAHPAVHEGKLSHMRSKQVSNLNLYRLGRNKRLGARMIASKFEPHDNWLPPCHKPPPTHHPTSGDQEMQMQKDAATDNTGCFIPYNLITQHSIPDKSIADCVEALIGAYLLECGPRGALLFMAWLGIGVLPRHVLPLPPDHPCVVGGEGRQKPPTPPSPKQSYSSSSAYSSDTESPSSESEWEGEGEEERDGVEGECWYARPAGSLRPRRDENGRWTQTIFGELRAPPSPLLRYVEDPEGELERMLSGYDALERTLQYRFRDRSLLLQALTHASHHQNRLTDCYQRLEFLGDAILDYLITRHLYEDARRHSPGALTDLRSALVNNTIFATLAARHGFHKYFRHMSPGLNEVLTKYVKIQEENGHSISEEHYLIQEDEMEQAEDVEVPKALGDLFESVAGAIFLDSGMSLSAVWRSYVRLMGAELEAFSAAAPKSPVRELLEAEPDTAKFGKPERLADGRRVRVCVEVFGRGAFKGIGRNYRIAKGTAARCALRHLRGARADRT